MIVVENRDTYRLVYAPSVFTKRNNASVKLYDVRVMVTDDRNYGAEIDGRYYNTVCVFAAESGKVISGRKIAVPEDIYEYLIANQFMLTQEEGN